ncbi:MAG TPA: metallophosphoesterase [Chloroflexota bacterium]|nr:metallophosphoesterase [Chloroflexota bacterium]
MKFVLFSDLHLDAQFGMPGLTEQAARGRRQGLRDTLERIIELAQEVQADALLCGGDLYEHERCSPDTAAFLQVIFQRLQPLPIYVAPGNHDWLSPTGVYQRTAWSSNVHIFGSGELQPVTLTEGITLWGAAHAAPANTGNFLEDFHVDRGGVHLALFHGAEQGWQTPSEQETLPHAPFWATEIAEAGLQHAFLGHYHQPRDAERHTYPGNPAPLSFGETGERGAVIVTVQPDGSLRRERRRVTTVEVHDLSLDVTGCRSQQEVRIRLAQATEGKSGDVRITIDGELAPDIDLRLPDLRMAAPWLRALVVRSGDLRLGYDVTAIGREPTVRGQFVRDVQADGRLTEQQRRRVLLTGLRALDGRQDLEAM